MTTASAVRAGEAYVEIAIKDSTGDGMQSALRNYGRLQRAAEKAQQSASRIQAVPGQGLVLPSSTGLGLRASSRGGVELGRGRLNPYELMPEGRGLLDAVRSSDPAKAIMPNVGAVSSKVEESSNAFTKAMGDSTKLASRLSKSFLGIGAALGLASTVIGAMVVTLEKAITEPSKRSLDVFTEMYSAAYESIPILGDIAKLSRLAIVDGLMGGARDRRETERGRKRNETAAATNERIRSFKDEAKDAAEQQRLAQLEEVLAAPDRLLQGNGQFATREGLARQTQQARDAVAKARQALDAEEARQVERATKRIREEARAADLIRTEQVLELDGSRGTREVEAPVVAQRIRDETAAIRDEFRRQREAIGQGVEERAFEIGSQIIAREDAEQQRVKDRASVFEDLSLDLKDRQTLLGLDRQEAALIGDDSEAAAAKREELAVQRELLAVQQSLDQRELAILSREELNLSQREQLIAEERALAESEKEVLLSSLQARIADATERARGGEKSASLVSTGTFSAIAARRRVSETSELQRIANRLLAEIASNTAETEAFA